MTLTRTTSKLAAECAYCLEEIVEAVDQGEPAEALFFAPCCTAKFHLRCVSTHAAHAAGSAFRCPLCRSGSAFRDQASRNGIRPHSWERATTAATAVSSPEADVSSALAAHAASGDLGALLDVSFHERSGAEIARLGGVSIAIAALRAALDAATTDGAAGARAAKILANVAGQLPLGARAAALAPAASCLAAAAATPPAGCRTTRRAAVGALLLLACDDAARRALERARALDALRAAANADDAGDDKTHGLVTRALHRLGALPAVVAAAPVVLADL